MPMQEPWTDEEQPDGSILAPKAMLVKAFNLDTGIDGPRRPLEM